MSNFPIALYSSVIISNCPLLPGRIWLWFAASNKYDNNVFCLVWSYPTTLKGHQREISKYFQQVQWSRCTDGDWRAKELVVVAEGWMTWGTVRNPAGFTGTIAGRFIILSLRLDIFSRYCFSRLPRLSDWSEKSWQKALRREFRPIVSSYACFTKGREDGLVGNHTLINRTSARATLSGRGNSKSAEFYPPPPRVLKLGLKNKSDNYNKTCQLSRFLRLG